MCVCCFALIIASREREALQLRESGGAFGAVSLSLVGRVPACSGTLGTQTPGLSFCPRPACWAPCEKTYLPLAVTIPLPLPSSSCAPRHRWVSSGMHGAFAESLARRSSSSGEEMLCFLWKCGSLRQKAPQGTKKWFGKERASQKDRKVSLKEENFPLLGSLGIVECGLRCCISLYTPCSSPRPSPWLPVRLAPLFQCLVGLGSPKRAGLVVLKRRTTLSLGHGGRVAAASPVPLPQSPEPAAAGRVCDDTQPSRLRELLPFPFSCWFSNLFLIDIFIPNTGKRQHGNCGTCKARHCAMSSRSSPSPFPRLGRPR